MIIIHKQISQIKGDQTSTNSNDSNLSLLDFAAPNSDESTNFLLKTAATKSSNNLTEKSSDLDVLCDIFTSNDISNQISNSDILQPTSVLEHEKVTKGM